MSEATHQPRAETHGRRRVVSVVAAAALIGAGIGIAAKAAGVQPTRVVSNSMSPAIDGGDWVVTRDLNRQDQQAIRRQDIVLYRFPLGTAGRAVKRVVAIAGDNVAIGKRTVTVDGQVIPIAGAPSEGAARRRVQAVPKGHVFLLGDNAAVSIDSRSFGPVPESEVVGRVLFVMPKLTLLPLLGLAAIIALIACGLLVARRHRQRAKRSRQTNRVAFSRTRAPKRPGLGERLDAGGAHPELVVEH